MRSGKLFGLAGWSGSGKTTLLTAMLPLLVARGMTVSTIKHAHHGFDLDQPGKDSWLHRQAGAHEVLVSGGARWALLHETGGVEPALAELVARLAPVDLVLVEGFRESPHPKLAVHRAARGGAPIWAGRADIVAVASDMLLSDCDRLLLPLNEPEAIVGWLCDFLETNDALHIAP
jgi:molybdopterin-guanine dinucleotide biosynthesis protein MobB